MLKKDIEGLKYKFVEKPVRLPAIINPEEVAEIPEHLTSKYWLITAPLSWNPQLDALNGALVVS